MTHLQFIALCGQYLVDPWIAIENKAIRLALKEKRFSDIPHLLETEF